MGEEMEGAVQQAAQPGLQFMRLPNQGARLSRKEAHIRVALNGPCVMRWPWLVLS